jgi:hypothetical protein
VRLPDAPEGDVLPDVDYDDLQGGYWRTADGTWMCGLPAPGFGIGSLTKHTITEHDDGTITVSPSILVDTGDGRRWHGYLERGVWRALDDCVLERPA